MAKKKDVDFEDTIVVDENEELTSKKEVWELNPAESLAYNCMKTVFVGGFMIGDLLGCSSKKDDEK
ncbi:hypothetical protein [Methanobrevibacter sp.]|uniref:hypothetical protein n=1 Tax=Methanobrevibacter sp. TaxID=66852 RepID=UPI00388E96CF